MSSSSRSTDVFETGKYPIILKSLDSVEESDAENPPKPLLIAFPTEGGVFPVVILLHGYVLLNSFYSQLLQHIASHGYIVIAPQLYKISGCDCTPEIKSTAALVDWLPKGLSAVLPSQFTPDLTKLVLSGHSRGGKTVFALARGLASVTTSIPITALIGIDPVDGIYCQTLPPVLTYKPDSFDLNMPVMVIGTGLGEVPKCCLTPACAMNGLNHKEFFNDCKAPAWHFVAKDYGHMDMLDDDTSGLNGIVANCTCKNGQSREPMRRFVGGIAVAFLRAFLDGDSKDLTAVKESPEIAPVGLLPVEFK